MSKDYVLVELNASWVSETGSKEEIMKLLEDMGRYQGCLYKNGRGCYILFEGENLKYSRVYPSIVEKDGLA